MLITKSNLRTVVDLSTNEGILFQSKLEKKSSVSNNEEKSSWNQLLKFVNTLQPMPKVVSFLEAVHPKLTAVSKLGFTFWWTDPPKTYKGKKIGYTILQ